MSNDNQTKIWPIIFIIALVIIVLIGYGYVVGSIKDRGSFGDMFGALNTLFSGLAFAVLIYTLKLQRNELELQRNELNLQRKAIEKQEIELRRTADIQSEQRDLMKQSLILELRNNEPIFIFYKVKSEANDRRLEGYVKNEGKPAQNLTVDVQIEDADEYQGKIDPVGLNQGDTAQFTIAVARLHTDDQSRRRDWRFRVNYLDKWGQGHFQDFRFDRSLNRIVRQCQDATGLCPGCPERMSRYYK